MAPSNVVILLIGLHGVGKSTFARAVTGRNDIELGMGTGACTEKCNTYSFNHRVTTDPRHGPKDFTFTIIDTPGLADRNTPDENLDVLQVIASQLRRLGQERVSGVIYFHSIEGVRLHGVDMANLRLLKAICGEPFFPRVAFVTTRWDCIKEGNHDILINRNAELEAARKDLLPTGPRIFRFLNNADSHQPILNYFARKSREDAQPVLLFAQELQMYRQRVKKTTAGKQVNEKKVRKPGICSFL